MNGLLGVALARSLLGAAPELLVRVGSLILESRSGSGCVGAGPLRGLRKSALVVVDVFLVDGNWYVALSSAVGSVNLDFVLVACVAGLFAEVRDVAKRCSLSGTAKAACYRRGHRGQVSG